MYIFMNMDAVGYWRTYSSIYYVHLYVQYMGAGWYWRIYSDKCYVHVYCVCTGVLKGTGEHTVKYIVYMCMYSRVTHEEMKVIK